MKIVESNPMTVKRGHYYSVLCEKCTQKTTIAGWCIMCLEKIPEELVRKRDFLNGMKKL
jgi:hypothetical protein